MNSAKMLSGELLESSHPCLIIDILMPSIDKITVSLIAHRAVFGGKFQPTLSYFQENDSKEREDEGLDDQKLHLLNV